jgi:hypothetical protein
MSAQIISIAKRLDEAWSHYIECKERAEVTLRMDDGIKAGRAWARWLELFVPSHFREKPK